MQICGGDWAKHSTDTGGYFRCNIAAPPPQESTSAGADLVQGRASGQPAPEAGQLVGAGLLGSLFGKFADAGAKWKLDYFMRRFLAHECSERQLQVHLTLNPHVSQACGHTSVNFAHAISHTPVNAFVAHAVAAFRCRP